MTATPWPQARTTAYAAAAPLPPVEVDLAAAAGCVLAGPLWSLVPLPAFDTAAMDGWAVRGPGPWRVVGRLLAGGGELPGIADGEALEIATGAQVPAGAEGVLPYEQGVVLGIELTGPAPDGDHVRRTGEECPARTALLPSGSVASPAVLGLAAAVGHDVLTVHPPARVVALVTGDELLRSGLPGAGRVRDAVGPLLPGAVAAGGGRLLGVRHLTDDAEVLRLAVQDADADVVITSGASSVGRADFLLAVLQRLDADVLIGSVAVRPGHPQVLARLTDGRLLVGLPGNPLAALAGLVSLLAPVLAGLAGRPMPVPGSARLTEPLRSAPYDHRLVPVRLSGDLARPTGHGGSAMLRGAAGADAFAVVAPGCDIAAGDAVDVLPLP
jgi:molybdopterin molybdotransferase